VGEVTVGERTVVLVQGDITEQQVDVIVTAANAGLRGGGGVDGSVHRAAGKQLLKACREIGGCNTGSAVLTPAFDLEQNNVKHILHAVGPVWQDGNADEEDLLSSTYRTALEVADRAGAQTIAFPSISTGVYGFPLELAAPIALTQAREFLGSEAENIQRVVFVLFDAKVYAAFEQALDVAESGEG